MTCDEVRRSIPLVHYAETSFDEEEAVHAHLDECSVCRTEFDRQRVMHRMLDERMISSKEYKWASKAKLVYPGIHYASQTGENPTNVLLTLRQIFDPAATEVGKDEPYSNTPCAQLKA